MRTPAPDVYAPDPPAPRRGSGRQRRITSFQAPSTEPWAVKGKTHADKVIAFIEAWCRVPSGNGHGQPVKLRPWQKRLIKAVYGPASTPHRAAVVSLPRGNGKTSLAAFMAVAELYLVPAAEVLTVAASMRQALIAYGKAARMIEMSPELAAHAIVYANKSEPSVVLPVRSSRMEPLPAEEKSLQGFAPTFCVVDEVGFIEPGTYTAMQSASGKHARSLVLGIGTPGYDKGLMYGMRERALSPEPPPRFVYLEYAADPGDDIKDKRAWKRANPALGDFLQPDALALDAATLPPAVFRTFRLGQWADRVEQWIPSDVWGMLPIVPGLPPEGSVITMGFDGSVSIDSTGLVGYDIATQRLFVVASWERPKGDRLWRVPRQDVRAAIDRAFTTWRVNALYADPYYFRDMLSELADVYGQERVVQYATNARARMASATDRFATAVYSKMLAWDGHEALGRHVLAAVAEVTPAGDVIRKNALRPQSIDLAVAAILAVEAAASVVEPPKPVIW